MSRSIFSRVDDRDRMYFGRGNENEDQIGYLGDNTKAIFGRSYAAQHGRGMRLLPSILPPKKTLHPIIQKNAGIPGRTRLMQRFYTGRGTTNGAGMEFLWTDSGFCRSQDSQRRTLPLGALCLYANRAESFQIPHTR